MTWSRSQKKAVEGKNTEFRCQKSDGNILTKSQPSSLKYSIISQQIRHKHAVDSCFHLSLITVLSCIAVVLLLSESTTLFKCVIAVIAQSSFSVFVTITTRIKTFPTPSHVKRSESFSFSPSILYLCWVNVCDTMEIVCFGLVEGCSHYWEWKTELYWNPWVKTRKKSSDLLSWTQTKHLYPLSSFIHTLLARYLTN